jgi:hypothetical protein
MGLIEDLNAGKYNLVLIGILFVFMFHQYWCKTTEPMADTPSMDQIKDAIKQQYAVDVEAIRNLSNVATQLQAGGLTIPGHLTTTGQLSATSDTNEGGSIRIKNSLKNGKADQTNDWAIWNMTGGYDNKLAFWRYNGDGKNVGPSLELFDNGNAKFSNRIATNGLDPNDLPDGWGGGIRTFDIFSTGTVACGKDKKINASMNSDGIMACTTINVASDYRIKDNVTEVSSNDNFDKLRPVTYFNKINNKNEIGFIAHEVQELFPELVTGEKDGETNQSVNYIGLIPLLVNEIKELKLKLKVKQLEKK